MARCQSSCLPFRAGPARQVDVLHSSEDDSNGITDLDRTRIDFVHRCIRRHDQIANHTQTRVLAQLDGHHRMERGKVFPVCGNTWRMLHDTRFREHFEFVGDFSTHHGIFEGCGTAVPFGSATGEAAAATSGGGCC